VHPTIGLESLSSPIPEDSILRTPSVTDGTGGAISEKQARERGRMVKVADQVAELAFENNLKVSDSIAASLLPTPSVAHLRNHDEPVENYLERRGKAESGEYRGMPGASLGVAVRMQVLPTPLVDDAKNTGHNKTRINTLAAEAYDLGNNALLPTPIVRDYKDGQAPAVRDGVVQTDTVARAIFSSGEVNEISWGKFEPAIRRWECVLQREAPAPTKPDGKDGAHRLSSEFTEWMMGLPAGWITGVGLKRNDELKACGNGVVPQQAELALRILLQGLDFESTIRGGLTDVLPTPTVMDQRDGKHFRAVAVKNLANGKNRGLNLNNVVEAIGVDWLDGDKFELVDGELRKHRGVESG